MLTTVLDIADGELLFPRSFLVVPILTKDEKNKSNFSRFLGISDSIFNDRMMIVFFDEVTHERVNYGEEIGLEFTIPKKWVGKMLGFWEEYAPVIKFAASVINVAIKATTGMNAVEMAASLVPREVLETLKNDKEKAKEFMTDFSNKMGMKLEESGLNKAFDNAKDLADAKELKYSTKDSAACNLESKKLLEEYTDAKDAKANYIALSEFLKSNDFDITQLQKNGMRKVALEEDEHMKWTTVQQHDVKSDSRPISRGSGAAAVKSRKVED